MGAGAGARAYKATREGFEVGSALYLMGDNMSTIVTRVIKDEK